MPVSTETPVGDCLRPETAKSFIDNIHERPFGESGNAM